MTHHHLQLSTSTSMRSSLLMMAAFPTVHGFVRMMAGTSSAGLPALSSKSTAQEVVDRFVPKAIAAGARLVKEPYTTYYNWYQAVLLDPEDNVFRINHMM
mgnify:CR=1 FL=1